MNQQNRRKSLIWILSWIVCFSSAMALAKLLKQSSPNIPLHVLIMIRSFFAFVVVLPLALQDGLKNSFHVTNKKLLLVRIVTMFSTVYCTYFAYQNLPLATATSIGFSGPLFSISFAIFILKERFSLKSWFFMVLGYIGVLTIVNPGGITFEVAILSSVLANVLAGFTQNITKILTKTEKSITLVLYGTSSNFILSSLLLLFGSRYLPTTYEFVQMFLIGGLGVFSSYSVTQALRYSSPTFVAPFEYTRMIFAIPVGYFVFAEIPTVQTYLGAVIIIVAISLLNYKSKHRTQQESETILELTEKEVIKNAS